jgi:hypothetical protein
VRAGCATKAQAGGGDRALTTTSRVPEVALPVHDAASVVGQTSEYKPIVANEMCIQTVYGAAMVMQAMNIPPCIETM